MNSKPLISIVLPTRNRAHLLPGSIDSCLGQTYDNWELIIVNDASTDDTEAVAQAYCAKDARIRYVVSDGKHRLPGALNRGFESASGDLYTWTSDDNYFEPFALEAFVREFILRPEVDFLYSDEVLIDDEGRELGRHTKLPPDFLIEVCVVGGSFMYRKRVRDAIGLYDVNLFLAEDYDYWLRIYLRGFKIGQIKRCLYRYRKHANALGGLQAEQANRMAEKVRNRHLSKKKLFFLRLKRKLKILSGSVELPDRTNDAKDPYSAQTTRGSKFKRLARWILHKFTTNSQRLNFSRRLQRLTRPVFWGNFRRLQPFSDNFGYSRGRLLDRYYIELFLDQHREKIRGSVLEIADNNYTLQFGGPRVEESSILHVDNKNPKATIVGDLSQASTLPECQFDCIILTQTLQFIYAHQQAVENLHSLLKPGGWLLLTTHGLSRTSPNDANQWGEYWRFTSTSLRKLIATYFSEDKVDVKAHGNVLVAASFLMGLSVEDLSEGELSYQDPNYEVIVTCAAQKGP